MWTVIDMFMLLAKHFSFWTTLQSKLTNCTLFSFSSSICHSQAITHTQLKFHDGGLLITIMECYRHPFLEMLNQVIQMSLLLHSAMKNQKGNKEFGRLLGLGQGKGRYGVIYPILGARFLLEMPIPDWVAAVLKGWTALVAAEQNKGNKDYIPSVG